MRRKPQTPIERAIAHAKGEVRNPRQEKYIAKRKMVGLTRIAVWVPNEDVTDFKDRAHERVRRHLGVVGDAE